jgi:hypothetical protein
MDPLGAKGAAQTLAGAVPQVTAAVGQLGDRVASVATGLEAALQQAQEKVSVDTALLVNASLLELQAWRLEVAAWREMVAPLLRGIEIRPVRDAAVE